MVILKFCNKIIEYSFYAIFLLVPLAFTSITSELFEFNKMWLTFILTILILASWATKMIIQKRIIIQKTPLDIPILLFLLSQIISTIFSLDSHTSLWGYYSRFNGGLFSIISYITLYYAFVSNFNSNEIRGGSTGRVSDSAHLDERRGALAGGKVETGPRHLTLSKMVKRALYLSLACGIIVALWGLPSHFGFDPTCLIFRGNFDVSCWTADFQPKIRIFSTLGQPNWMAAYLAILIPIALALAIKKSKWFLVIFALFFLDLLYTKSQSGFLGLVGGLLAFAALYFLIEKGAKKSLKLLLPSTVIFIIAVFFAGTPIERLNFLTFPNIQNRISSPSAKQVQKPTPPSHSGLSPSGSKTAGPSLENNITGSQQIRSIVWKGALDIWKHHPIFGTGVETFAFAYYQYRPAAHNLTSEWNFLYNKAHNEYLNYLAATGIVGLGTYLSMIFVFLWIALAKITNSFAKFAKQLATIREKHESIYPQNSILVIALLSSYISILVTNFFGFSVVITNVYLFMIPAFVFVLAEMLEPKKQFIFPNNKLKIRNNEISLYQWTFILFIILGSSFMILKLFRFWQADVSYAYGSNLDRAGNFQQAYPYLHDAVSKRPGEPVFRDEMAINDAVLATELLSQNKPEQASQTAQLASSLAQEAILTSNQIVASHPNNVVFWKSRVRIFYTLGQIDSRYLPSALDAIKEAQELAPTDANISYNLGVLYGQNNDLDKGIEVLGNTIKLRPSYRDAYYALGLFYHQKALDKNGKVANFELQDKAIGQMKYILNNLLPNDGPAKQALESWEK